MLVPFNPFIKIRKSRTEHFVIVLTLFNLPGLW